MDSSAHTPASTIETAATTPASQDGSTTSQNNLSSRPGGHAAKQSVANAAMLFAGGTDDPFASIGAIEEEPETASESLQSHDPFSNDQVQAQDQYGSDLASLGQANITASHHTPSNLQITATNADQSLNDGASPLTPSNLFADKSSSDLFGPPNPTSNDDWLGGGSEQEPVTDPHQQQADPYGQYEQNDQNGHANHYSQEGYHAYVPQISQDGYQEQYGYDNYDQSQQQYSEHQYAGYEQSHQQLGHVQSYQQHEYEQPQQQHGYDQQQYAAYTAQHETDYNQNQYPSYDQQQYSGHDQQQYSTFDQNQYAGYDQQSQNGYQAQGAGYDQPQQNVYQPQDTAYDQHQQNEYHPEATSNDHQQQSVYQPQNTAYDQQQQNEYHPEATSNDHQQQSVYQPQNTAYDQPQQNVYQPQDVAYDQHQQNEYHPEATSNDHQQQSEYRPPNTAYDHQQQSEYQPQTTPYDNQQYAAFSGYAPQQQEDFGAYNESQSQAGYDYHVQQQDQHTANDHQQSESDQQQPQQSTYEPESIYESQQNLQEQYNPAFEQEQEPDYGPQAHNPDSDDFGFANNFTQSAAMSKEYSAYAPTVQRSEQTTYGADRALSSYSGSHSGTLQHETNPGRARIPLACFSIDGKLITYFPSSNISNQDLANGTSFGNGYGPLHGSAPSQVTLRSLSSVIPSTTYATSMKPSSCPGPLFEIGGSQISALSRATGSAASTNKNKKAALIKHLQDAANDLSGGLSYYQASKHAFELKRQEDRILLIRILSTLLEHDGNMTSNTTFDKAVIDLLLAEDSDQTHPASVEESTNALPTSVITSQEKKNVLREVEHCLIKGERRDAVTLAKDHKLWTHAVIIASGMDKDTWQDVVRSFMDETLDDRTDQTLKTAYGLFSGQDVKATYDLFRPKQSLNAFSAPSVSQNTDENSEAGKQSLERRKDWRRSVAMILANRSSSDLSHLTAIGDGLSVGGWLEGAHVCYLLSLPTSGIDGFDGPGGARLTLLGTHSPAASSAYLRDLDAIILTEVLEFALSLRTVPKGGEQFQGLPHLQAYRIIHALLLAEMGEAKKALKYCEAITNLLKSGKMNKYYHPGLLQHLQELSDRLSGGEGKNSSPNSTGSGSWAKKKPTMDGVWGALENRFTKFIAGEDDASSTSKDSTSAAGQNGSTGKSNNQVGAFTHFSAITPEATSRDVSRVQSYADFSNSNTSQHPYNAYGGLSSSHAPPQSTPSNASFSRPASRASSTLDIHGSTGRSIVSPLSQAHQSNYGYVSNGNANRNPASASATMTTNSSLTNEEQAFSDWPTSAGPSHRSRDHSHLSRGMDSSFDTESYEGPYKTHATRNAPWNDGSSFSGGDSTLHAQHNNGNGAEGSYDEEGGDTGGESDKYGAATNEGNYMPSEGQPYYGYEAHGATGSAFVSNVNHDLNEGGESQDLLSPMDALGGAPTPTFNTYASQASSRHVDDDDDDEDDLGFGNSGAKRRQQNASNQNYGDDEMNGEDNSSPGVTPKASAYDQKIGGRGGESEGDKSTDSVKTADKQGDEQKQGSSWFGIGRLWGSRKGTPDPTEAKATKAHMGNESSFYYDKELKRWVNKAAGDTPQAATPPPPPPRAATASPSVGRPMGGAPLREAQRAVSSSHLAGSGGGPPPARSSPFSPPPRSSTSSTISELGEEGEGEPGNIAPISSQNRPSNYSTLSTGSSGPRARSNLADHSQPPALQQNRSFSAMSDASTTSATTGSAPPRPPPGGSMKKKPISKRYVRVD